MERVILKSQTRRNDQLTHTSKAVTTPSQSSEELLNTIADIIIERILEEQSKKAAV